MTSTLVEERNVLPGNSVGDGSLLNVGVVMVFVLYVSVLIGFVLYAGVA